MLSTSFIVRPKLVPRAVIGRKNLQVVAFKITLKTPAGDKDIEVPEDKTILDAAEEAGVDMPYSCRSGTCSSCAGKVIKGEIDQSEQQTLDDGQIGKGFALLCVTYAKSDATIQTNVEDQLF